jgi:hypothetical protein
MIPRELREFLRTRSGIYKYAVRKGEPPVFSDPCDTVSPSSLSSPPESPVNTDELVAEAHAAGFELVRPEHYRARASLDSIIRPSADEVDSTPTSPRRRVIGAAGTLPPSRLTPAQLSQLSQGDPVQGRISRLMGHVLGAFGVQTVPQGRRTVHLSFVRPVDTCAWHQQTLAYIRRVCTSAALDSTQRPHATSISSPSTQEFARDWLPPREVVVLSHHAPYATAHLANHYRASVMPEFVTPLEPFIERYSSGQGRLRLWLYGHAHYNHKSRVQFGRCLLVSNARGGPLSSSANVGRPFNPRYFVCI